MPRTPRLDFPGAFHHVIGRGIERREIFVSDDERREFLDRLSAPVRRSGAGLYAWCLMANHFHLFLRTGLVPLSRLLQGLLGGYVDFFNRRHDRSGHLFQNRFKSTLVEAERYGLELVRYIHLNPVRSRLGVSLEELDDYPWTGHPVLLGKRSLEAHDTAFVLEQFGRETGAARAAYREFVRAAVDREGRDLDGGGLRRSAGGWEAVETFSGGVNIYPSEVESVLLHHPKVGGAAVFGIPNEDWGEEVKAVIAPAPGVEASPALAQEILDFCLKNAAKYKCPKSIDFIANMPRDPNGKLYKRKLRDPY